MLFSTVASPALSVKPRTARSLDCSADVSKGGPMDFEIEVGYKGRIYVVKVCGDVDVCTAPMLDDCLQRLVAEGNVEIAVDLENCSYFDSEGIKVLVKALRAACGRGRINICGARGTVSRVLEISGLEAVFGILPSVDDLPHD